MADIAVPPTSVLERRPVASAVGIFIVVKVLFVASVIALNIVAGRTHPLVGSVLSLLLGSAIMAIVYLILRRRGWASIVGFNSPSRWRTPWLIWLPALLILLNLSNLLSREMGEAPVFQQLLDAVVRGITVPLVEESVFRGLILATLLNRFHKTRVQVIGAVLLDSLLFGLWHLPPNPNAPWQVSAANVIYAVLAGVGFCAVVLRTGSIWLMMLVHGLIVLANVLVPVLGAQKMGTIADLITPEQAWRSASLSILACLPLFFYGLWLLRDPKRLNLDFAPARER